MLRTAHFLLRSRLSPSCSACRRRSSPSSLQLTIFTTNVAFSRNGATITNLLSEMSSEFKVQLSYKTSVIIARNTRPHMSISDTNSCLLTPPLETEVDEGVNCDATSTRQNCCQSCWTNGLSQYGSCTLSDPEVSADQPPRTIEAMMERYCYTGRRILRCRARRWRAVRRASGSSKGLHGQSFAISSHCDRTQRKPSESQLTSNSTSVVQLAQWSGKNKITRPLCFLEYLIRG